ncbi:MAG: hypothetical protein GX458_22690 [Phyllobacteriaceae bacterium]|jgi:hypothetical protein|nr:hypothetical protein [Phyllobacteriaceae bacterium]
MLGRLIDDLDEPETAARLLRTLEEPDLVGRLEARAAEAGRPVADVLADTVHGFLDEASDEDWLRLIGLMNRAEDPGLAAVRAILGAALAEPTPAAASHD